MSDTFYPAGYVLTGKYEGKNIYKETRDSFVIVSGDNDNKIVTDSLFKTYYQDLKTISRSTVKCYEDVSSVHHGPNMSSVAKGAFWFGAAGALVSAAVSQSNTYDIALEFNDGDKFLIRITVAGYYQEFKRIFFDFPTITQNSTPVIPSNTDQNLQGTPVSQVAPLLERAYIFLEDGDFAKADEYFEKVLDLEPKNANAYVGKLLVDLKINNQAKLSEQATPDVLTENPNFIKAQKYGDKNLVLKLDSYVNSIKLRIKREYESTPQGKYEIAVKLFENAATSDDFLKAATAFKKIPDYMDANLYIEKCYASSVEAKYQEAFSLMSNATSEGDYTLAANIFKSIPAYKDSEILTSACLEKAECAQKDFVLDLAKKAMESNKIKSYKEAIKWFESVKGWKDADAQIIVCQKRIEEIETQIETERLEKERQEELSRQNAKLKTKRNKKIAIITTPIVCVIIAFIIILNAVIIPNSKYNDAIALMNDGKYSEAITAFESLNGYKDSIQKINDCQTAILDIKYNDAIKLMEEKKYVEAVSVFQEISSHKDSKDKIYSCAVSLMEAGKYSEAISVFEMLSGYRDSSIMVRNCKKERFIFEHGQTAYDQWGILEAGSYITLGKYEQDNKISNGKEDVEWLVLDVCDGKALVVSKYVLDWKQYNTTETNTTWETCSLRTWLNSEFISATFSHDESSKIAKTTITADSNPEYGTSSGNATTDSVFLLNLTEFNTYFSADVLTSTNGVGTPTKYAIEQGAHIGSMNGIKGCYWWLRTPGRSLKDAAVGYYDGRSLESGSSVHFNKGVRPAMWIDLNS